MGSRTAADVTVLSRRKGRATAPASLRRGEKGPILGADIGRLRAEAVTELLKEGAVSLSEPDAPCLAVDGVRVCLNPTRITCLSNL
mmetsp:Transcript_19147/g.32933  ORF Transcript_19147/g.32933 Transcript_19147/m.32933 type:complete len:86 (-) Transcript_19147:25-282(-)